MRPNCQSISASIVVILLQNLCYKLIKSQDQSSDELDLINTYSREDFITLRPQQPQQPQQQQQNNQTNDQQASSSFDDECSNKFKCRCKLPNLIIDCSQLNLERVPLDLQQDVNYLNFTSNMLLDVQKSYFERYINLKTLKLKRNIIKKLGDGAFYDLHLLENLSLDGNRLTEITGKWLFGLTNLQKLSLNHNRIESINGSFWGFIPNINYMSLGHNKLKRTTRNYFHNLKSLLDLRLHHNYMTFIEPNSFVHMRHLKFLDLSSNKLEVVLQSTSGIFNGLIELERLDLQNNEIDTIRADCFEPLINLRSLDMRKNQIRTLQPAAFVNLIRLTQFDMDSQRLTCDCDIEWLISATKPTITSDTIGSHQRSFVGHEEAICAYPESLRMLRLRDLLGEDYRWRLKRPYCDNSGKPVLLDERPINSSLFIKGHSSSLSCRASVPIVNNPAEKILITWQKYVPGFGFRFLNQTYAELQGRTVDPADSTREIVGTTLELENIDETYSGEYQCVVSNRYGNAYSKTVNMTTHIYPYFISTPRDTRARVDGSVDIVCATYGIPSPVLSWSFVDKDNKFKKIPAGVEKRIIFKQDGNGVSTLSLTKLSPEDEGTYSCRATSPIGFAYANFTLSVNPRSINSSNQKNFRQRPVQLDDTKSMLALSTNREILVIS